MTTPIEDTLGQEEEEKPNLYKTHRGSNLYKGQQLFWQNHPSQHWPSSAKRYGQLEVAKNRKTPALESKSCTVEDYLLYMLEE